MNINYKLDILYKHFLPDLIKIVDGNRNISCPLLPFVYEDYNMAKKKILFIGKETHGGWSHIEDIKYLPIDALVNLIKSYYVDFDLAKDYKTNMLNPNSAFWRFCYAVYGKLNDLYLETLSVKDYPRGFIWLNSCRVDESRSTPKSPSFYELIKWSYKLLEEELKVLEPDVIILMGDTHYKGNVKWYLEHDRGFHFNETPIGIGDYKASVNAIECDFFRKETNVFWIRHPERKANVEVDVMINQIVSYCSHS